MMDKSNPQETVELCPFLEKRGYSLPHEWDGQWCRNCGKFRETLPNKQSPELAEPHVVQTPQESSPGFEEAARQILFRVHSSQPLGLDYKDAVKAILAVHNDDIQEAKREEREACVKVARYWLENDGRPKHLIQDLEEPDKTTLEHLEEETT